MIDHKYHVVLVNGCLRDWYGYKGKPVSVSYHDCRPAAFIAAEIAGRLGLKHIGVRRQQEGLK